jgi:hypothetical protein
MSNWDLGVQLQATMKLKRWDLPSAPEAHPKIIIILNNDIGSSSCMCQWAHPCVSAAHPIK